MNQEDFSEFNEIESNQEAERLKLKLLNQEILKKSQIDKFAEICQVNNSITTVYYNDFNYNEKEQIVNVIPREAVINIGEFQVSCKISQEQIQELQSQWGIDVIALTQNALTHETGLAIFKNYKKTLDELSSKTYLASYTRWDKFKVWLYKIFKKEYIKKDKSKNITELFKTILDQSHNIFQRTQEGGANFVICNVKIGTALQQSSNYVYGASGDANIGGAPYAIGNFAGITVYVDPCMTYNDNTVYIGQKAKGNSSGLKFFYYGDGVALLCIAEGTMSPKIVLRSRFSILPIGKRPEDKYTKIILKDNFKYM